MKPIKQIRKLIRIADEISSLPMEEINFIMNEIEKKKKIIIEFKEGIRK